MNKKVKSVISIMIVLSILIILIFCNLSYMCYTNKNEDGFQIKTGWELLELQLSNNYDFKEIHISR